MKSHRYLQSTNDVFFSFYYLICILQFGHTNDLSVYSVRAREYHVKSFGTVTELCFTIPSHRKTFDSVTKIQRNHGTRPRSPSNGILAENDNDDFRIVGAFFFFFNRFVFSYVGAKGRISGAIRVVRIIRGAASGAKTKPVPSRTRVKSERVGETVSSFSELAIFTTRSTLLFGRWRWTDRAIQQLIFVSLKIYAMLDLSVARDVPAMKKQSGTSFDAIIVQREK